MKDKLVYNAGCFAGESDMIRDLCLTIYLMTFTNPYPNPDQFALNVLIQMSPWKEMTRFTPMADVYLPAVYNAYLNKTLAVKGAGQGFSFLNQNSARVRYVTACASPGTTHFPMRRCLLLSGVHGRIGDHLAGLGLSLYLTR